MLKISTIRCAPYSQIGCLTDAGARPGASFHRDSKIRLPNPGLAMLVLRGRRISDVLTGPYQGFKIRRDAEAFL